MRADIVQVLDWAIDDHEGMVKACESWRPAHEHCPSCQRRARHAARLRALRDAITRDREANAAWDAVDDYTPEDQKVLSDACAAERALLSLCREAGA